jgi:hypothetical protein
MTISSELSEILALRLSQAYQDAEAIRQQLGAEKMATYPATSAQYGALRLLIGTWENIAIRVRGNDPLKVPFYETNPVGYMWNKLSPGIAGVRSEFPRRSGNLYAHQFYLLNRAYTTWLKSQPVIYRTAALQGINAQFG